MLRDRRLKCAKYTLSSNYERNIFCNRYNVTKPLIRAFKLTDGQNSKQSITGVTSERSNKWNTCCVIYRRCRLLWLYSVGDWWMILTGHNQSKSKKQYRNRPGVAQRVPGGLSSQISWHSAREFGEVVSLTHRQPLPPGMFLVLIFTRGWVDPRDMVRSEGICHWKIQWHHRESIPGPSD